jgi:hypothetical protein
VHAVKNRITKYYFEHTILMTNKHDSECGCSDEEHAKNYGREPMNPEDIAKHDPTAVKRDKDKPSSGEPV